MSLSDQPEQSIRFCTTRDNVRIACATLGAGPPLVKVANWLSHLEYDWQSPVWNHWLRALATHHTYVRYDERGCGLSDWDVEDMSFEAWISDLEAVVDAMGLDRFPLLGISQGGSIAVAYAARHPERVSHLILYGAYARGRQHRDLSPEEMEETQTLIKLVELGWGRDNPAFRQVFSTIFIPDGTPEQVAWFNELQRLSSSPENAARIVAGFDTINVTGMAQQVKAPTLVLHCQDDVRVPFEEGRHLAALIPGAQFVPLEGSNHVLLETDPAWPRFLAELYRFLGVPGHEVAQPPAPSTPRHEFADLTLREREVLELVARGYRNTEIARELVLSPKTVRNYVSNILGKLGVSSRGEAIVLARDAGLGQDEG